MFVLNDDNSIYATRGDIVFFSVSAYENDEAYTFQAGDVLRIKVFEKKNAESVVLQKDFSVAQETESVEIVLTKDDTKIGDVISKPKDYWYEVELNPLTNPQTIIGYGEDGAAVFKLFPEGADIDEYDPDPEDFPVVDTELDATSPRPVSNNAIASAILWLHEKTRIHEEEVEGQLGTFSKSLSGMGTELSVQTARIDNLASGDPAEDAELTDLRVDAYGNTHATAGNSVRGSIKNLSNVLKYNNIGYVLDTHFWKVGALNTETGAETSSATRIITGFTPIQDDVVYLGCADGYKACFMEYKWNGTEFVYIPTRDWLTGEKAIRKTQEATHYRIMAGATDNTAISVNDATNVVLRYKHKKLDENARDLEKCMGLVARATTEKHIANNTDNTNNRITAQATRRWFFSDVVPANSYIREMTMYFVNTTDTITVEVWEKNGNTLSMVKEIPVSVVGGMATTINIHHYTQKPCMVSVKSGISTVCMNTGVSGANTIAVTDLSGTEIDISSGAEFAGYLMCGDVVYDTYNIRDERTVLTVGDGMMFSEIQDALDSITDTENQYVIKVSAKKEPYERFSMTRKLTENYSFTGGIVRNISIIGEDRRLCVVKSNAGNYYKPAVEPLCNGVIKGLTFLETHENQDASAAKGGYAAHIDCTPEGNTGYDMAFDDCVFISHTAPAVGVGLQKNCQLTFRNCEFYGKAKASYAPFDGFQNLYTHGAVFIHTATSNADNQNLLMDNCRVYSDESPMGIWLGVTGEYVHGTCRATFQNTLVFNDGALVRNDGITITGESFGNNSTLLNNCGVKE